MLIYSLYHMDLIIWESYNENQLNSKSIWTIWYGLTFWQHRKIKIRNLILFWTLFPDYGLIIRFLFRNLGFPIIMLYLKSCSTILCYSLSIKQIKSFLNNTLPLILFIVFLYNTTVFIHFLTVIAFKWYNFTVIVTLHNSR